jgi:hypothetical protein
MILFQSQQRGRGSRGRCRQFDCESRTGSADGKRAPGKEAPETPPRGKVRVHVDNVVLFFFFFVFFFVPGLLKKKKKKKKKKNL